MSVDSNTPGAGNSKSILLTSRWRFIIMLFILYTINCIDRIALSVGMPLIAQDFSLSGKMQGLILSAFFWAYCLCQIPGGKAADRWGGRTVIGVATVIWGAFQCLSAIAVNGVFLLLTRVGLGAFEAPFMPSASKLTASWLPSRERGRGITLIDSGAPFGSAVGGLLVASLIAFFSSWRIAFFLIGVLTIVAGIVVYLYARDTPHEHKSMSKNELDFIDEQKRLAGEVQTQNTNMALSKRTLVAMVIGRIGWAMVFFGLVTWGPSYLANGRGMDLKAMGYATFIIFLCGAIGEVVSGYLVDRLQRVLPRNVACKLLFGISGSMALVCLLALPFISDSSTAVIVLAIGVFFHLWGGLYWIIPAMLSPANKIGLVGGVMNFAGTSSGIFVPIIVGFLVDMTGGYTAALYFFAGCAFAYLLGSLCINFGSSGAKTASENLSARRP